MRLKIKQLRRTSNTLTELIHDRNNAVFHPRHHACTHLRVESICSPPCFCLFFFGGGGSSPGTPPPKRNPIPLRRVPQPLARRAQSSSSMNSHMRGRHRSSRKYSKSGFTETSLLLMPEGKGGGTSPLEGASATFAADATLSNQLKPPAWVSLSQKDAVSHAESRVGDDHLISANLAASLSMKCRTGLSFILAPHRWRAVRHGNSSAWPTTCIFLPPSGRNPMNFSDMRPLKCS